MNRRVYLALFLLLTLVPLTQPAEQGVPIAVKDIVVYHDRVLVAAENALMVFYSPYTYGTRISPKPGELLILSAALFSGYYFVATYNVSSGEYIVYVLNAYFNVVRKIRVGESSRHYFISVQESGGKLFVIRLEGTIHIAKIDANTFELTHEAIFDQSILRISDAKLLALGDKLVLLATYCDVDGFRHLSSFYYDLEYGSLKISMDVALDRFYSFGHIVLGGNRAYVPYVLYDEVYIIDLSESITNKHVHRITVQSVDLWYNGSMYARINGMMDAWNPSSELVDAQGNLIYASKLMRVADVETFRGFLVIGMYTTNTKLRSEGLYGEVVFMCCGKVVRSYNVAYNVPPSAFRIEDRSAELEGNEVVVRFNTTYPAKEAYVIFNNTDRVLIVKANKTDRLSRKASALLQPGKYITIIKAISTDGMEAVVAFLIEVSSTTKIPQIYSVRYWVSEHKISMIIKAYAERVYVIFGGPETETLEAIMIDENTRKVEAELEPGEYTVIVLATIGNNTVSSMIPVYIQPTTRDKVKHYGLILLAILGFVFSIILIAAIFSKE